MGSDRASTASRACPARVRMVDVAARRVSRGLRCLRARGRGAGPRVGEKTAARIRRIARQLNYHPNHAARQLAGKGSGLLGAVAGDWFHQTPLRVLSWLNHLASARGFDIVAGELHDKPEALDASSTSAGPAGWTE